MEDLEDQEAVACDHQADHEEGTEDNLDQKVVADEAGSFEEDTAGVHNEVDLLDPEGE